MKAFLLHRDADFNLEGPLPAHAESLSRDLELDTVLAAMAGGDPFLFEVSQRVLLASLHDPEAIVYRQQVLSDCLANPSIVRELYVLAGHAIKAQRSVWGGFHRDAPRLTLSTAVQKMELLVGFLRKLRAIAAGAADFRSPGFISKPTYPSRGRYQGRRPAGSASKPEDRERRDSLQCNATTPAASQPAPVPALWRSPLGQSRSRS
jgi:hypothetical protein